MNVTINIFGAGECEGGGEHAEAAVITLFATPAAGNVFKKFVIGSNEYFGNPKYLDAGTEDVSVDCYFYTPFELYIRGSVSFDVPDLTLNNVRISRGILYLQDVSELSTEKLELALADVLMYGASRPSSVTTMRSTRSVATVSAESGVGLRQESSQQVQSTLLSKAAYWTEILDFWLEK